jgi:hypothetical protein
MRINTLPVSQEGTTRCELSHFNGRDTRIFGLSNGHDAVTGRSQFPEVVPIPHHATSMSILYHYWCGIDYQSEFSFEAQYIRWSLLSRAVSEMLPPGSTSPTLSGAGC